MRVGLISTFPPRHCGVGDYVYELVHHLIRTNEGDEFFVNTFYDRNAENEHSKLNSVSDVVTTAPDDRNTQQRLRSETFASSLIVRRNLSMDMWGPRIIKAVKKSCELDLIHAQSTTFLYPPMFDTFPLFLGKTPLVVTAHDVPHYRQFHALPFLHLIYSRAKSIIVLSHHVARELKHYHGNVVGSKVRVMHHGVDVERFRPDVSTKPFYEWLNLEPSFFTFMSFGFLGQGKGTDLAVKAFKKFLVRHSKSNIDFRFIIAGSPRDADQGYATSLKSLIDELRLKSQVIITGYVPSDLVPSALASADVLVYPYLGVSQSGPVHRSLATGRPVVVSDIEGFREIITDGDNGLLIRENDVDSISNAFDRLYTNESVRLQIGDGARQYAEKFLDWKKVAGDTLELYRSITKTQRATCQEFQDGAEVD